MAEWAYNPITGNLDRVGSGAEPGGTINTINGIPPDLAGDFVIESSDGSVTIVPLGDGIDLKVPVIAGIANSILTTDGANVQGFRTSLDNNFTFTSSTPGLSRGVTVENTDNTDPSSISFFETSVGGTNSGSTFFRSRIGNLRSYCWGINTGAPGSPFVMRTDASGTSTPQAGSGIFMVVTDETGNFTKPNNSSVSTDIQVLQSNVTGDGTLVNPVIFESLFYDQNNNYNTTTGLFTARITGKYNVRAQLTLGNLTSAHSSGIIYIVSAGAVYGQVFNPGACRDANNQYTCFIGRTVPCTAGQTIFIMVQVSGGSKDVSIQPNNFCSFSGSNIDLVC